MGSGEAESVYHQPVENISAYILAGGRSTRMRRDKAFLELGGRTLLARAWELARSIAGGVSVVGDPRKFQSFGRTIEDALPGCGPLGGIHAALTDTKTDLNLILAVDLPFVTHEFLAYLLAQARNASAVVTVPRAAGGLQPLCAIYRRQFEKLAASALKEGNYKIDVLFGQVETRIVDESELLHAGFSASMFHNLNTPREFALAERAFVK